jgi:hypothetical protein
MSEWREYPLNREYLVSSDGEILGRIGKNGKRRKLKYLVSECGYAMHKICIDGKMVSKGLHRIMAETFIPNPEGLSDVDHINKDKLDNRLENLRWLSHKANCHNRDNSQYKMLGMKNRKAIIAIDERGVKVAEYVSITEAAKEILKRRNSKASPKCIVSNITSGIKKGLIRYGFYWKYAEM